MTESRPLINSGNSLKECSPKRETIMAEGGEKPDKNPFSFKNFSKKKSSPDSAQTAKDDGNIEDGGFSDSDGETHQKADQNDVRPVEGKCNPRVT